MSSSLNKEKKSCIVVSVCGAGGKTTYIEDQSKKLSKNQNVLVSTTTKMGMPKEDVYDAIILKKEDFNKNKEYFLKKNDIYLEELDFLKDYMILKNKKSLKKEYNIYYFMQEVQIDDKKQKFMHITDENIKILKETFSTIFLEADGSRRLKLKYPKENEPVISKYTDKYVYVFDMTNIGETLNRENVYNFEDFEKNISIKEGQKISEDIIYQLIDKNAAFKNLCGSKILLLNKIKDVNILDNIDKKMNEKYKDIEVVKKFFKEN